MSASTRGWPPSASLQGGAAGAERAGTPGTAEALAPSGEAAGPVGEAPVGEEGLFHKELWTIGSERLTVLDLIQIAAVVLAAFLVSRAIQRGMARTFKARGLDDEGTLSVAQRLTHYVVMTVGVFVGFKIAHIDLTALAAAGALFAVVVGFAMQNFSENFVSGVILMVERSIKQGDVLAVEGRMVRIVSMGVRATVARTLDDEELIIPNSAMVKDTVKNYTLADRLYRLHTSVGVSYQSDMKRVRLVLEQAARDIPFRSREHEPRVLMKEFADSSVVWDVSIWMTNPWYEQTARSQLNEAIWFAFKSAEITIAYPQLDLHVDARVGETLRELAGS